MKPVIEYHRVNGESDPIYACGHCKMMWIQSDRNTDREAAEKCCLCEKCGTNIRVSPWTLCESCRIDKRNEKDVAAKKALQELPEVDDDGGPVYANGNYYDELEDAVDSAFLDDVDLATLVVHPCTVTTAGLPDVIEYIEESVAQNFDDSDWCLSKEETERLKTALDSISLPDMWIPNEKVRLKRTWPTENDDAT